MTDEVLERLARVGQGDRDGARRQLLQLWGEVGADEVHRCAVAHALADLQDDVHDELRWDLVALEAAAAIRSDRLAATGAAGPPAALYPSLHLNVADCYRRLGDLPQARAHVAEGLRHTSALADDGYGRMVLAALRRLDDGLRADGAAADRNAVEQVVHTFFAAFTSGPDVAARLDGLRRILLPEAVVVRTCGGEPTVYDVDGFIAPRQALLAGGHLADLREWQVDGHTEVFGDIAHHFCSYAKSGVQHGEPFTGRGRKTLQLVRTGAGWRISAVAWDDEREGVAFEPAAGTTTAI